MSKNKVIEAFQEKDSRKRFNSLLNSFVSHPNSPPSAARYFNVSGYSPENLKMLEYDCKQLYGVTASDINTYQADTSEKPAKEAKKAAKKAAKKKAEQVNPYTEAPDAAKEALKLRDEFPFLKDKDCPDEFKILVADKFTALEEFEKAHAEIQKVKESADADTLFALGKQAVENWELNREIYEELDHYKEHGEILGNHPIFEHDMLQAKVNAYSIQDAMKRQGNLRSYISRESKKLESIKDEKKRANVETKISDWQAELDLIDARLNADEKKK